MTFTPVDYFVVAMGFLAMCVLCDQAAAMVAKKIVRNKR